MRENLGNGLPSKESNELVMGYRQAAVFLCVSERSLERYVREGLIPYVRLPKRGAWTGVRFVRSELLKWLERRTVRPRRQDAASVKLSNL